MACKKKKVTVAKRKRVKDIKKIKKFKKWLKK